MLYIYFASISKSDRVGLGRVAMILWTIQHTEAWKLLQRHGVLYGDMRRVLTSFRPAYRWLMKKLSFNRPPIWAWYAYGGTRKKPDLRESGYLNSGTHGVRIEFDAPDELVSLSRFDLWNLVLNDAYLSFDEQHDVDNPTCQQKRTSWRHIFNLEFGDPEYYGAPTKAAIQAALPLLRFDWVRSRQYFKAR